MTDFPIGHLDFVLSHTEDIMQKSWGLIIIVNVRVNLNNHIIS